MARIRYLDVLRGVALLGILPANIVLFALPLTAGSPMQEAEAPVGDVAAYVVTHLLFDYKFITLFSLLFGVGIALMHARANAGGRPFKSIMRRRLLFLWLFGAMHAVFLWFGDILAYYAICGLAVAWTIRWQARTLLRVGLGLVAVPAIVLLGGTVVTTLAGADAQWLAPWSAFATPPGDGFVPGSTTGSWKDFFLAFEHFGPALETEVYRDGSWGRITVLRLMSWFMGAFAVWLYFVWRVVGLFLIGMALGKSGWIQRLPETPAVAARLVSLGLLVGLPLQIAALVLESMPATPANQFAAELCQYVGSCGLAAAYAGWVARWTASTPTSSLQRRIEAVGRTAFSNYILQSIVCTTIFYGTGLALFGSVSRAALLAVVVGVWLLQLMASPAWLARWPMGPLEWLWRKATYGRATRPVAPSP
jgi:uncharacterized protein